MVISDTPLGGVHCTHEPYTVWTYYSGWLCAECARDIAKLMVTSD